MENLENIVPTMIGQHRVLQKDLGAALELVTSEASDIKNIINNLEKFSIDLPEHLQLENGVFYPNLISKMKERNIDTAKTEDFINQMKEIGVVIMAFLDKYKAETDIESQLEVFKEELASVVSALNLRVESEESGVYGYWEIYQ
ncbi:MAG: hemerythrin domain-containing protein [Candidatus Falkowbacteria bacterium]|nr:hemerythrin domain-containing protein [Candidatus Falkowbacteria bacterium]